MARTGLLIVTSISKIANSLSAARKFVEKILYVQLYAPNQLETEPPAYSHAVQTIYATSAQRCGPLDVRVLLGNLKRLNQPLDRPVDVLLFDNCFTVPENVASIQRTFNTPSIVNLDPNSALRKDNPGDGEIKSDFPDEGNTETMFDDVVLGGTFDRLHVGHKILLSEAVLRARKRLVVGVTDVNMIKSKTLSDLILPLEERIANVKNFLNDIDSTLTYEVVPIQDPFGPAITDPDLKLIVVSAETIKGGQKINEIRLKNNLPPLYIHIIELVESQSDDLSADQVKESKISSSNQRHELLGRRLREPEPNPNIPNEPYVIGLTGGIASGKSKMAKRFEELGAAIVDCDKLAHQLYEPDTECYNRLVDEFGADIVGEDRFIDRKRLGSIVFGDEKQLERLNKIVWPRLLERTKEKIAEFHQNGSQVVIIEAAILLQAGWQRECHEVWSLIVPQDEAIKRLMERNNLSEEDALKRIQTQADNRTIVENSHIVFSSQWSDSYTQQQAEKCWKLLIDKRKSKL